MRAFRSLQLDLLPRLLLVHGMSLVLLSVFVFVVEANNIRAPLSYVPAQALWLAIDWVIAAKSPVPSRRRQRRSSKAATGTYRPTGTLALPNWVIPAAVGALTIAYIGYGWRTFSYEAISYHDVLIGSSPQEAIYSAGKPVFGRNADTEEWQKIAGDPVQYSQWMYRQPLMVVMFAPNRRVAEIRCTDDDKLSLGSCWSTLAIGPGSSEGLLYEKLGMAPAGGTTADGKRIASYPELGHDFVMEQFYVRSLRIGPSDGNTFAKLWRFFLWLVP